MYVLSLTKSFFKPKSFLTTLYFIMNNVIIFFLFYIFNLIKFSADTNNPIYNGLVGLSINLLAVIVMLSPFGESILRFQIGAKKIDLNRQDDARLYELFKEVYKSALAESPHLGEKIILYVERSPEINAAALGQRTLIVNSGLANLPDGQIKAIMAHEFGHLANRDGDMHLAVCVSNVVLTIIVSIFRALFWLVSLVYVLDNSRKGGLVFLAAYIFEKIITLLFYMWLWIGMTFVNVTSRQNEFQADKYACEIGYGKDLYNALETMDPSKKRSSFFALISRTHPDTVKRLEKIRENVIV